MMFVVFVFLFSIGLRNRYVMIMSGVVSIFLGFTLWSVTGTILFMPMFIFVFAICITITITTRD